MVIQTMARTMMDAAVTEVSAIPAVAAEAIDRLLFYFIDSIYVPKDAPDMPGDTRTR